MKYILIIILVILATCITLNKTQTNILGYFISNTVKSSHTVILGCELNGIKAIVNELLPRHIFVLTLNINKTYNILPHLTHKIHAKTSVILDCKCDAAQSILYNASEYRFFNKTYNWILLDEQSNCERYLIQKDLKYLGPNAQITQVKRNKFNYFFFDIHSKGRHLRAPIEINLIAKAMKMKNCTKVLFDNIKPMPEVQGIKYRDNFSNLTLRAASVIDRDNITSNIQINKILRRPSKDIGVSAFSKYHYELLELLRERLSFKVNFRNARGWAGKIENSTYRLGYIGIMQRNEADIGASASYNRLNRFPYLDIIDQSWMFKTSFLFRFTPDLNVQNKKGNFFAPFEVKAWIIVLLIFITLIVIWMWIAKRKLHISEHVDLYIVPLHVIAAISQQGLDPMSKEVSSRIIIMTTFIFSLLIYNYYTSSLVGGLLSTTEQGPTSVEQITSSELRLSFEDIGYYKILFRENKSSIITRLLNRKVLPPRDSKDLPVYTNIEKAIPYLKRGGYAFHCEVVDAYPEIAKHFDATEICDLRVVSGLLVSELINYVVHKNSQYTELFRIIMIRARETGIIKRLLRERQPKKPKCEAMYTVYPVNFSGIIDAFILFGGGVFASLLAIVMEINYR